MVKRVFGSYNSEEEAIHGVEELQEKGYKADDLLLMSNKDKREVLEENTNVEVKSSPISNGNGDSLIDKIKRAFTQETGPEDQATTQEKLVEHGLSEEQASRYAADVEDGKILIAADEASAGSTIRPLTDPNLDPVAEPENLDKVTGKYEPTEDMPRSSMAPTPEEPEPSLESTHPAEENRFFRENKE